jgi:ketol-acid reductoisomerase
MTKIFRESDATLEPLHDKTIAILGYGNQGSAQALNLRDSGIQVIVGNADDSYAAQARADGFPVYSIAEAAERGDVVMTLLPDEITPAVYNESIRPGLKPGNTLTFASGYCVCYNQITFPSDINVIMVAPRTMGAIVREDYLHGRGFLSFVDVHQDMNGQGWPIALGLAKAIGSLKMYALQVSFKDETELDLLTEQALVPAIVMAIKTTVETALKAGYPKVASVLELYLSGEMGDVLHAAATRGLVGQTALHSPTSQFGTKTRLPRFTSPEYEQNMRDILAEVQSGAFAEEWGADQAGGYPQFKAADQALRESLFAQAEREVIKELEQAGVR